MEQEPTQRIIRNKRKEVRRKAAVLVMIAFAAFPVAGQTGGGGPGAPEQDSVRAAILYRQAKSLFDSDSLEPALETAGEALHSSMQMNLADPEMATLALIAAIYEKQGRAGDAIPYHMRMANILETRRDTAALAGVYLSIAGDYRAEEVYGKVGEYYLNVLNITPEDDLESRTRLTEQIGLALMQEGLPDSALFYLDRARDLAMEAGGNDTQILERLVEANNQAGNSGEALDYNGILFNRSREDGDYGRMAVLKNNMAYDLSRLGNLPEAAAAYEEAVAYGEKAGLPKEDLARMQSNAGICYQNMEMDPEARQSFQKAMKSFDEAGRQGEKSRVENIVALIYYHEGDLYNAGLFSRNSIESAREAHDPEKLSTAFLTYSRVLREGNDPIRALEYYEK